MKYFGIIGDKSHLFCTIVIRYCLNTVPIQLQDVLVRTIKTIS